MPLGGILKPLGPRQALRRGYQAHSDLMLHFAAEWARKGAVVLLPDLPCHGRSDGRLMLIMNWWVLPADFVAETPGNGLKWMARGLRSSQKQLRKPSLEPRRGPARCLPPAIA